MNLRTAALGGALLAAALIAGCSSGSSSPSPVYVPPPIATATPTPTATPVPPPLSATGTVKTSTTGPATLGLGPIGAGYDGTFTVGKASAVVTITDVFSLTQPSGTPKVKMCAAGLKTSAAHRSRRSRSSR